MIKFLTNKGYNVVNYGTNGEGRVDYTTYGFILGEAVANNDVDYGIAICGSGIGISIALNKIKGVYCAKVNNAIEIKLKVLDAVK